MQQQPSEHSRPLQPTQLRDPANPSNTVWSLLLASNPGQQLESDFQPLVNPKLIHSNVIPL
jgi:hypothetical protein